MTETNGCANSNTKNGNFICGVVEGELKKSQLSGKFSFSLYKNIWLNCNLPFSLMRNLCEIPRQ